MKFFSSAWHAGDLPDEQVERTIEEYEQHVAGLLPSLSEDVRRLVTSETLHDAIIRRVHLQEKSGEIELEVSSGDNGTGYRSLLIHYQGVPLDVFQDIRALPVDRVWEILYDEIDREGATVIHRLLLWPYREIEFRFRDLTLAGRVATGRGTRTPPLVESAQ